MPGAAPVGQLDVAFTGLRSNKGMLRICVTRRPASFPSCRDDPQAIKRNVPATATSTRFDALPTGDYAVAVIHDANGNAKLDTMLGIPKEGFGFSRNPAIGFGPPAFSSAQFPVTTGAEIQQIRIRYLL
ncbi:DUF2141 domain-containing protein [Sphingomonas sp. S2-65]|nr:DUF2141 domain-containing protein [Sphingomonas sp. S2-65]